MSMTPNEERRREEMRQESKELFAELPKKEQAGINALMEKLSPLIREQVLDPRAGMEARREQELQILNMEAAARRALTFAQNQLRNATVPMEQKVNEMYPAVDKTGKYCVLDVRAAEQEARIDAALQNCNPGVEIYVNNLRENPAAKALKNALMAESKKHRLLTYAAESYEKLFRDMEELKSVTDFMRLEAKQLETSRAVMDHTIFMEGLEHAVGLNKSSFLSKDVVNLFKDQLKTPLEPDMLNQAKQPNNREKFTVVFENLENIMNQHQRSDPANWDKFLAEDAPLTEDAALEGDVPLQNKIVEKVVAPYARGTTDRLMDALFARAETAGLDREIDRGDLIIIDGKTVRERIYENYMSKNRDPAQFDAYYKTNCKRLTNECVAAGLMADKRVEIFVPDKNGRIPATPAQITRSGYDPSPLKPVALNAWQRFWSQYGFYKQKVAQVEEYQRMEDARNRVTIKYHSGHLEQLDDTQMRLEKQFTQTIESEYIMQNPRRSAIDISGTKFASIAVCRMLADEWPPQDIYDPTKLQEQKAQAGEEVLDMIRRGDYQQLGENMAEGQFRLMKYFDEEAKKVDFTDHRQLCDAQNKTLHLAAITARDIIPIVENGDVLGFNDRAFELFEHDGLRGCLMLNDRMRGISTYLENVRQATLTGARMVKGLETGKRVEDVLAPVFASQIDRDRIMKAKQGMPLSEILELETGAYARKNRLKEAVDKGLGSKDGQKLVNTLTENAKAQTAFGRDLLTGRLEKQMTFDSKSLVNPFRLGAPEKAAVNKQPAPQKVNDMGGMTR